MNYTRCQFQSTFRQEHNLNWGRRNSMIRKIGILSLIIALNSSLALADGVYANCENGNISFTIVQDNRRELVGFLYESNKPNQRAIEFECERSNVTPRGGSPQAIYCSHSSISFKAEATMYSGLILKLNDSEPIELKCDSARVNRTSYQAISLRCYKYNGVWHCPHPR